MAKKIQIRKGLNIRLGGEAMQQIETLKPSRLLAVQPDDFKGLNPKLLVKEGDEVLAGTPLFFDRMNEDIKICSPVSGEVAEIMRGDKRKLLAVKILADKVIKYLELTISDPSTLSREDVKAALIKSGAWPLIRQRPFGFIANPADEPKAIFISAFDSSPLAPDNNFIFSEADDAFQAGLEALQKLTDGKVHLTVRAGANNATAFTQAKSVELHEISGPHPAGNVGVQIHHIQPVNKGEVVWCLGPQDVQIVGRVFTEGKFRAEKIVAVTGSQVAEPRYYRTIIGDNISGMLQHSKIKDDTNRIISGNVLSGRQIKENENGFLGFYDHQLTVIPEGDKPEFMGWLTPGLEKFSASRTFFSWMKPMKTHLLDTNMHGEERPFVVTGEYEKVFPMNIYPVQLLKSILIEDIEMMENLGIYEVVEEDFALCEVICTSKIKSQAIISQGIALMQREFVQ